MRAGGSPRPYPVSARDMEATSEPRMDTQRGLEDEDAVVPPSSVPALHGGPDGRAWKGQAPSPQPLQPLPTVKPSGTRGTPHRAHHRPWPGQVSAGRVTVVRAGPAHGRAPSCWAHQGRWGLPRMHHAGRSWTLSLLLQMWERTGTLPCGVHGPQRGSQAGRQVRVRQSPAGHRDPRLVSRSAA